MTQIKVMLNDNISNTSISGKQNSNKKSSQTVSDMSLEAQNRVKLNSNSSDSEGCNDDFDEEENSELSKKNVPNFLIKTYEIVDVSTIYLLNSTPVFLYMPTSHL